MALTRRGVLFGAAAVAVGLATTSCGRVGLPGTQPSFPSPQEVTDALRDLVKEVGQETFLSVRVSKERLYASLLVRAGVRKFMHDSDGWQENDHGQKSVFTPPVSVRVADLPLARLPAFVDVAGPEVDDVAIDIDYVGKVRVTAHKSSDEVGLKLDGTGTVPALDPDTVSGVKAAVAEMVASYGRAAERVGSFNGFVHVDANVAGTQAGVRIVRYPQLAAQANLTQETLFSLDRLFDPSGFDPTTALTRKATIAREAGVDGRVWSWQFQRPPKGGNPLVSFGIGPNGPSTRVWLDENGKIAAVTSGECPKDSTWCPG